VTPEECQGNMRQQHTERFASTLSTDSNKTSSNSSGCKDYHSEYKKHYQRNNQLEIVEVLSATVRKPDVRIPESSIMLDNGNKVDALGANHSRLFCSPEVTESMTDSKLLLYNVQDGDTTPEHMVLPPQRQDAIPADNVLHDNNNNLQPVGQGPDVSSKETTQQHLLDANMVTSINSPVTVTDETDRLDDDQDGDVMVPQDASSHDNGLLMMIPKGDGNILQPVTGN